MTCKQYEDECRPLLPENWDIKVTMNDYEGTYRVRIYCHKDGKFMSSTYTQNGIDKLLRKKVIHFTAY
jgi:hypothetical protein